MKKKHGVTNNIVMLYIMNITQLLLPLITLPYLTRVLSVDGYGVVAYVKSIIIYATLVIEFGFMLSATREVVSAKGDKNELGKIIGRTTQGKLFLSLVAFMVWLTMALTIPLLKRHFLFVILSFGSPFLSVFLFDYLFRGIEQMQIITYRFLMMRGISTALTFIFIKGNAQLILIPIFDIIGSLIAVIWVSHYILVNLHTQIRLDSWKAVFKSLKVSAVYFISDMASTAFGAFNTLLVGIYLSAKDVAYWGILSTLIAAVQTMYAPICDGIYPHMLKTKSIKLLTRIILIIIPLLIAGGCITYFGARYIMYLIGGVKYIPAAIYLKECTAVLIITFFSNLLGWPTLGAINRVRETTMTTIVAAGVQVVGLIFLIFIGHFSLFSVVLMRTLSELSLMLGRLKLFIKYRASFNYDLI